MNRFSSLFYNFSIRLITVLAALLFSLLSLGAFLKTAYVSDAYGIEILLAWDNPLMNVFYIVLYVGLILLLGYLFLKLPKGEVLLLILSCLWIFCSSVLWVWLSKSGPASDCGSVYYAAKQFARNDFSALSYRDSYFSVYPFQLGLAFFYEIIFRIVRNDNFHILQGVNALCQVIILISQFHLTKRLCRTFTAGSSTLPGKELRSAAPDEKKAALYSLLLTDLCLPFIMYGSYIYGEIPSFAFILFGTWMLLVFLEKGGALVGVLAFLSLVLSVMVRKNTLIFLIALGIVLVLLLIKQAERPRPFLLFYLAVLFLCCLLILPLVQNMYGKRSGTEINRGVPSSTYFAMGLMTAEAGPGHYNGYNFDTFTEKADYDSDVASEIGWQEYRHLLSDQMRDPVGFGGFLTVKFYDQWLNAGWAIFDSTYVSFGERLPVIESCFSGPLYRVLVGLMSGYQLILYLLGGVFCLLCFKTAWVTPAPVSTFSPESLLFPLTAIGGALFYLMWEASGRYVLPYAIFMIPCAAVGLERIIHYAENRARKNLSSIDAPKT